MAYDALVAKLKKTPGATIPPAPIKPEMPVYSISQPTKSFIVSLKPGKYKVRTLDTGVVIKDSTKDVDAFVSRRSGIGYESSLRTSGRTRR